MRASQLMAEMLRCPQVGDAATADDAGAPVVAGRQQRALQIARLVSDEFEGSALAPAPGDVAPSELPAINVEKVSFEEFSLQYADMEKAQSEAAALTRQAASTQRLTEMALKAFAGAGPLAKKERGRCAVLLIRWAVLQQVEAVKARLEWSAVYALLLQEQEEKRRLSNSPAASAGA